MRKALLLAATLGALATVPAQAWAGGYGGRQPVLSTPAIKVYVRHMPKVVHRYHHPRPRPQVHHHRPWPRFGWYKPHRSWHKPSYGWGKPHHGWSQRWSHGSGGHRRDATYRHRPHKRDDWQFDGRGHGRRH